MYFKNINKMFLALAIWLLAVAFTSTSAQTSEFRSVCYYTNWPQYRIGKGKYVPENVDPFLCTHLIYAFAKPVGLDLAPIESNDDNSSDSEGMYSRIMKHKQRNTSLKVLLAVGGTKMGSAPFIPLVQTEDSRNTFANNVVTFLRRRSFDGFEMAWQYPGAGGSTASDKPKFQLLMETLRQVFDKEANDTGKSRLLLTVAVPAYKSLIDNGYMIPELSSVVDFISILTFDYHGINYRDYIGFNSPLYAYEWEKGDARRLNLNWTAQYYVSLGAPKEKLNIGIATYGRSFVLRDPIKHGVLSTSNGAGNPGRFTNMNGIMAYYEVCDLLKSGAQSTYVSSQKTPYVVKDNQWIGYDDKRSVLMKACYARKLGFGGVFFWSLDFDDFSGESCDEGTYPLIRSARSVINGSLDNLCIEERGEATPPQTKTATANGSSPDQADPAKRDVSNFRFVCYYTNWAQYRPGVGKFFPEDIDVKLCTHIIFAFAKPVGLDLQHFEWNDDDTEWAEGMYKRVMRLKTKKPSLIILLAAGGWNMASYPFVPLVQSDYTRTSFAFNVLRFLRTRKFDGFDLDWEYPGARGSGPEDRERCQLLLEKMREVFNQEADSTGQRRLLLTIATAAAKETIDNGYIVNQLIKVVDFISIMSYDYHGAWVNLTGLNAPMYAHPDEEGDARKLNINWTANYYVSLGAPKEMLNIGISTYGRSFTLKNPNEHGMMSIAIAKGRAGGYTREAGVLSYYEVCELIDLKATVYQVPSQGTPYLVKDELWVGYDDIMSVERKACFAKSQGFGGVLFWTMDLDDFKGQFCHQGKYPLLTSAVVAASGGRCDGSLSISKDMAFSTSDGTRGVDETNLGSICLCLLTGLGYMMW